MKPLFQYTFYFILSTLVACSSGERGISFYHWKTKLQLTDSEVTYLEQIGSDKLYLRFFDVKWNTKQKAAFPTAVLQWEDKKLPKGTEIIPVVYITNETMGLTKKALDTKLLVENIAFKINSLLKKIDQENYPVREVQFDCDWTVSTKEQYFEFLKAIQQRLEHQPKISATIRLHQVKFFEKTGVPPVDKGVLMFYNMGDLTNKQESNSILNLEVAQNYLGKLEQYPLDLDIALPLFSWGVQFREDEIVQLLYDLNAKELSTKPSFEKISQNNFQVQESTFFKGTYLYKNDQIRLEKVSLEELEEAKIMLKEALGSRSYSYILYHLEETIIEGYPVEEIQEILF